MTQMIVHSTSFLTLGRTRERVGKGERDEKSPPRICRIKNRRARGYWVGSIEEPAWGGGAAASRVAKELGRVARSFTAFTRAASSRSSSYPAYPEMYMRI